MATVLDNRVYLFALEREATPFRHSCRVHSKPPHVVIMGAGRECAKQAIMQLLQHAPAQIICAGFAGALRDDLQVGDVIDAGRVIDGSSGREMQNAGHGAVLTMDHLIGDPAEKRRLGAQFNADLVDMESAVVAQACAERGIPWSVVRVVSDDVNTRLSPELLKLLAGGRVSIPAVLKALIRQPTLLKELLQLQRATRLAACRLATALAG